MSVKKFNEYIKESVDNKYEITVTISNLDETDLKEFQKFFAALRYSGGAGASREIKVYADGDGAFRPKIEMNPEPNKELEKEAIKEYGDEKLNIGLGC